MNRICLTLKSRKLLPTRWIYAGLMASLLAASMPFELPLGRAALAEEAGKGGHSDGGKEGGNAKAQGRSAQDRAQRHRERTGQTLGGGERTRNRYGGGNSGGEPGTDTPGDSDGADISSIDDDSLAGGSGGAEHYVHDGTGYWGVDGKVLRRTATTVLPNLTNVVSAAALGGDCSVYRPESSTQLRMQGSNRARLSAAQALLAPDFADEGKVSGLSLLAEYQKEMERLRPDHNSTALYMASVSTRPVTVALIQAVNATLCVACSLGVAEAITATAEPVRIEMVADAR